jgi:hypothetical protein
MAYLRHMPVHSIVFDLENDECPGYVDHEDIKFFTHFPDGRKRGKRVVRKYLYTYLLISLAGIQGERLFKLRVGPGSAQDVECARDFAAQLFDMGEKTY